MTRKRKRERMPRRKSPQGMRSFVRDLILERHRNPPNEPDTLRHGMFYVLLPKITRFAQEQGIDLDRYDETHKQNFGTAVYKTISSVLSKMVLAGETSYAHLNIIETERIRDEAAEPDFAVEVWAEKQGLHQILKPIKKGLNISLFMCKGFQSSNVLESMVERIRRNPVKTVLILSDWDSSGVCIPEDIQRRAKRLGIKTKFVRIGVMPDQIPEERRALSLVQLKKKDSRYKEFARKHGTRAYEVDALSAREIRELVLRKLAEYGVDINRSVETRFKENQKSVARAITETLLKTLKTKIRKSTLRRVQEYETREPTKEHLIESILSDRDFLEMPDQEIINRIATEVKEEFDISDDDDEDEDDD